uniref:Reticulon-like protein n=1 Tax=Angiostrongylus cantonensis TaxID=6313 RepID=A0A0K0DDJ5_ANGCA
MSPKLVENEKEGELIYKISVLELLHWRDPKKSGVALSLILLNFHFFCFTTSRYPIISVLAYTGLAVLAGTLGFRVYKTIEAQVKKTSGENPFQEYLSKDLTLPQERIHAQVDVLAEHAVLLANHLKRLIFVENIVDSAKFALILWAMTYIGYWFSGFVLVVLGEILYSCRSLDSSCRPRIGGTPISAVLAAFSVPKVYEMYKEPIDAQLAMISQHTKKICTMAEEKLPFLKKLSAEGEKKEQ